MLPFQNELPEENVVLSTDEEVSNRGLKAGARCSLKEQGGNGTGE